MLVKNNTTGVIHLGEAMSLMPGVSSVDERLWKGYKDRDGKEIGGWKDHPTVVILLDPDYGPSLEVLTNAGLSDMTVPDAVKTVRMTVDSGLLDRWAKDEKRKLVSSAIADQKAKITPG